MIKVNGISWRMTSYRSQLNNLPPMNMLYPWVPVPRAVAGSKIWMIQQNSPYHYCYPTSIIYLSFLLNQLTSDPPRVANKMIKTTWKTPKSHVVLFSCWIVPHDNVEGSSFFCFSFSIDARSSQSRTRSTWESWLWILLSLFVILTFNDLVFSIRKAIDGDQQKLVSLLMAILVPLADFR